MTGSPVKEAFAASVDGDTRLLLLGSLPGEVSLAARQYYANPTNQLWRLIGAVVGDDLAALPYPDRLRRLLAKGVGLWDVVKSARRSGSLDSAIKDHRANDLGAFAATLPALRAIAFNGGTAFVLGRKQLQGAGLSIALETLPSSSAAYCSISFDAKRTRWLTLRSYLEGNIA